MKHLRQIWAVSGRPATWTVPVLAVLLSINARAATPAADAAQAPLDCVIEPSAMIDLGSATPGVIADIPVDRTDSIKAGQVIAELESDVERATLNLARARAQLNTTVELRRVSAKFGERQQERHRDLVARNLVPKQDYDRLKTEAQIANLQAREASDERSMAFLEYKRAEAALERRVIRSPIDGVVVDRYKSTGEYVEDQPVIRIAKIDTLHVEILAPIELMGRIRQGMSAEVKLLPEHLGTRVATVTRVDAVADAASGTFGVRLELDNANRELPAGLRCLAEFANLPPAAVADQPALNQVAPHELAGP